MKETYAYSSDGENYQGDYDTPEEAAREAFAEDSNLENVEVAVKEIPVPEKLLFAEDILEAVTNTDEFSTDWADPNWPIETKEQKEELEEKIREVFGAWIDKHNMRPTWFTCRNPKTYTREMVGM